MFSDFDYRVPFDGKLTEGEYYIDIISYLGNNTIKLSNGFYPYVLVKYLLEVQALLKQHMINGQRTDRSN